MAAMTGYMLKTIGTGNDVAGDGYGNNQSQMQHFQSRRIHAMATARRQCKTFSKSSLTIDLFKFCTAHYPNLRNKMTPAEGVRFMIIAPTNLAIMPGNEFCQDGKQHNYQAVKIMRSMENASYDQIQEVTVEQVIYLCFRTQADRNYQVPELKTLPDALQIPMHHEHAVTRELNELSTMTWDQAQQLESTIGGMVQDNAQAA